MKKILIITYYWPPSAGGGVQRWLKFTKHLPSFGWKPIIFTPENPHYSLKDHSLLKDISDEISVIFHPIWEPYQLAGQKGSKNAGTVDTSIGWKSSLFKWIRANVLIPDPRVFWVRPAVKELKKIIAKEEISIIVSTGPPHSMHLIALRLKKWNNSIKWVADFRDPWTNLNFYKKLNPSKISKSLNGYLESKVLKNCDIVLSTSPSTKEHLAAFDDEIYRHITNGYDESDFSNYRDLSVQEKIVILHAGTIKSDRNPKKFFYFLNEELRNNTTISIDTFELRLIGVIDDYVLRSLQEFEYLSQCVNILPYCSHNDLINTHYAEANILLLLINDSDSSKANIPGKLFEYIRLKKSIICFGKMEDDASCLVNKVGGRVFQYEQEIRDLNLSNLSPSDDFDFTKYSRLSLTKNLSKVLYELETKIPSSSQL